MHVRVCVCAASSRAVASGAGCAGSQSGGGPRGTTGLVNLGNTCFLNATVQVPLRAAVAARADRWPRSA